MRCAAESNMRDQRPSRVLSPMVVIWLRLRATLSSAGAFTRYAIEGLPSRPDRPTSW